MNLAQARVKLRAKVGNPTTANVTDAALTSTLNDSISFITSRYPFHQTRKLVTFPTVVGTDRYTIPADLLVIRRLWDNTNKKQIQKRGIRFLSTLPLNYPAGKPKYYIRDAGWIQIIPTVDAINSIMLSYIAQPVLLVGDTDLPTFPESWHDGWVLKARHIYYDEKGDVGKAIYARNEWKDWVADKPSEIDQEKDDMDSAVELPELAEWARPTRDFRYDPLFDTEL